MSVFVLIVTVWTYSSNGGNAVAMHDFSSLERCDAARKTVLDNKGASFVGVQAQCVQK